MALFGFQHLSVLETIGELMDLKTKILLELKMLDEGIAPYVIEHMGEAPTGAVSSFSHLEEETQRKAKRKFRKLWKKAYKRYDKTLMDSPVLEQRQRLFYVRRYLLEELLQEQELDDSHI